MAINSIEKSREFNPIEMYQLTKSPDMKMMFSLDDGTCLMVKDYLLYEDINEETEEVTKLLTLMDEDGEIYAVQSSTFIASFQDITNFFDSPYPIKKISGKSKGGRNYINCTLDTEGAKRKLNIE